MDIFWTVFWIMLLIVPALWLASIIWTLALYTLTLIIGGIVAVFTWLFERFKEK